MNIFQGTWFVRKHIFILIICGISHYVNGQVTLDNMVSIPGNYSVGFTYNMQIDSTRSYSRIYDWTNRDIPRPIPVGTWYPSNEKPDSDNQLSVLDYMRILKKEEEWESLPDEQILNWFYYPNTAANRNHLKERTNAFKSIKHATGLFPVIIYAPSYQASSSENFALCEFLASHGYIVLSSPSRGADNRYFEGGNGKDLETQTRDIEFLIEVALRNRHVNSDKIAVMGFSFGGMAAVLAQMRNTFIKAIVSLDGSSKYQYQTLASSPFSNPGRVNVPFIHFSQKDIPEAVLIEDNINPALNTEFALFDSLRFSEAYHFKFNNLTHSHFSTMGVLFEARDERQDKSDHDIMESYSWMADYTLNFLNAFLKNDMQALQFLNQNTKDVTGKSGVVTKTTKRPTASHFSFSDFNDLASVRHYQNLGNLYDSLQNHHPDLMLQEGRLNNLGLQLAFDPVQSSEGIAVLVFAINLYPASANLWDSLGEVYLFTGNTTDARISFEKSLELNPQNQNAVIRLEELKE